VRRERKVGEPIYYGDATHEAVLRHADIEYARAMVIVINDPPATRRITELAKQMNSKLHVIVRTRFIQEMKVLYDLGADEVIPEEFETSVEIFSRVLRKYLIPKPEIEQFIAEVRAAGYDMLRNVAPESITCSDLKICFPDAEIATFRIGGDAPAAGRSVAELALRKRHGVTLLTIRRGEGMIYNPEAETLILAGDILWSSAPRKNWPPPRISFPPRSRSRRWKRWRADEACRTGDRFGAIIKGTQPLFPWPMQFHRKESEMVDKWM